MKNKSHKHYKIFTLKTNRIARLNVYERGLTDHRKVTLEDPKSTYSDVPNNRRVGNKRGVWKCPKYKFIDKNYKDPVQSSVEAITLESLNASLEDEDDDSDDELQILFTNDEEENESQNDS